MSKVCGKETLIKALHLMCFEQIKELYQEYQSDSCGTEYAFGFPYYVEDKESTEVANFIGEYMEKYWSKELSEGTNECRDEVDSIIENG